MRTKVTALLLDFPRAARFWRKHHSAISTIFVLALTASFAYSAHTTYYLVRYGTCEPGEECNIISFPARVVSAFDSDEQDKDETKPKRKDRLREEQLRIVFFRQKDCPVSDSVNRFLEQRIKPNYPVRIEMHTAESGEVPDRLRKIVRRHDKKPQVPTVTFANTCLQDFNRARLMELEQAVRRAVNSDTPAAKDSSGGKH